MKRNGSKKILNELKKFYKNVLKREAIYIYEKEFEEVNFDLDILGNETFIEGISKGSIDISIYSYKVYFSEIHTKSGKEEVFEYYKEERIKGENIISERYFL